MNKLKKVLKMKIVKERSRLIVTEYTETEDHEIEKLVSTMDNIFIYRDDDKEIIYLPTGLEKIVTNLFKITIEDKSNTYWDYATIKKPDSGSFTPRDQLQKDVIGFTIENAKKGNNIGIIAGPGTGKTSMTISCLLEIGMRSLIIVPTTNIRGQWKESLIRMFNVPESNITEVDSPNKFFNIKTDFTIVLQATLSSLNRKYDLEKIMKANKFGVKVIDEVHMYFHNTIKIDGSSNIKNNWYLTATFGRSAEEENKLYHQMFSAIEIFRVKDKDPTVFNRKPGNIYGHKPHMNCFMYWATSELTDDEIKSVSTSKRYNERDKKWMRYGISIPKYTALVIPPNRKTVFVNKILEIVKIASKIPYGRMLILSPTIESVEILADHIQKMFPKYFVGTIHSHNSKEVNDAVKSKADILISTVKSSGTGFDVKDLSVLVCAEQFKSPILAEQVSGRLRRRSDGKDTYMYDIVDASVPQLRAWGSSRAELLKRKSKKFTVIDL
jgi:superfamily II DNA or RNA helicase